MPLDGALCLLAAPSLLNVQCRTTFLCRTYPFAMGKALTSMPKRVPELRGNRVNPGAIGWVRRRSSRFSRATALRATCLLCSQYEQYACHVSRIGHHSNHVRKGCRSKGRGDGYPPLPRKMKKIAPSSLPLNVSSCLASFWANRLCGVPAKQVLCASGDSWPGAIAPGASWAPGLRLAPLTE